MTTPKVENRLGGRIPYSGERADIGRNTFANRGLGVIFNSAVKFRSGGGDARHFEQYSNETIALVASASVDMHRAPTGAGAALVGFSVRTWQIPDGSTNAIFGLAQSPDGYLWIGTTGGLNRFDGVDYQTHQLGSQYGLSDSRVRMLLTSRSGGLWVVLDRAVVLLRLNQAPIVIKENIPPQRIESMVEESDGVLWLGYRAGPIVRIKDGIPQTFDGSGGFPQADSARPSLALDNNGVVWLARATPGNDPR